MHTSALAARLFNVFAQHGFVDTATVHWPAGDQPLAVGFTNPTEQVFAHRAELPAPAIEYLTADAADLDSDMQMTIDTVRYEVASAPRRGRDGSFSIVDLRVVP